MDPIKNPFSPERVLLLPSWWDETPFSSKRAFLLGRVKQKRPEKSMLLRGLRGVGKTVLLKEKGMIYSPAHGDMAFTVPLFGEFMIRAIPTFKP